MSEEIDGRELLAIRARAARSQDGQHQSLRQTEADRHALVREVYRLRSERDALKAAAERARRMAQVWVDIRPTHPTASDAGHGIAFAGQQILDALAIPEAPGGES